MPDFSSELFDLEPVHFAGPEPPRVRFGHEEEDWNALQRGTAYLDPMGQIRVRGIDRSKPTKQWYDLAPVESKSHFFELDDIHDTVPNEGPSGAGPATLWTVHGDKIKRDALRQAVNEDKGSYLRFWLKQVPVSGSVVDVANSLDASGAIDSVQEGRATSKSFKETAHQLAEQKRAEERKKTWSGFAEGAGRQAAMLPGLAAEFYMTRGIATAGRVVLKKAVLKQLGKAGLKKLTKAKGLRGLGGKLALWTAGESTRAAAMASWRLPAKVAEKSWKKPQYSLSDIRMLDSVMNSKMDPTLDKFGKALGSHFVEVAGESLGATLTKLPILKQMAWGEDQVKKGFKAAIIDRLIRKGKTPKQIADLYKHGQFDGLVGELSEELAQQLTSGALGFEDNFGTAGKLLTPKDFGEGFRELSQMAIAFSLMGAGKGAANYMGAPEYDEISPWKWGHDNADKLATVEGIPTTKWFKEQGLDVAQDEDSRIDFWLRAMAGAATKMAEPEAQGQLEDLTDEQLAEADLGPLAAQAGDPGLPPEMAPQSEVPVAQPEASPEQRGNLPQDIVPPEQEQVVTEAQTVLSRKPNDEQLPDPQTAGPDWISIAEEVKQAAEGQVADGTLNWSKGELTIRKGSITRLAKKAAAGDEKAQGQLEQLHESNVSGSRDALRKVFAKPMLASQERAMMPDDGPIVDSPTAEVERPFAADASSTDADRMSPGAPKIPLQEPNDPRLKPESHHEILASMERLFGLKLARGRIQLKKALGIHKLKSLWARFKSTASADVAVHTHELAHHVDTSTDSKIYNSAPHKAQIELTKLDYDKKLVAQGKGRLHEGFAEFMRLYWTNPNVLVEETEGEPPLAPEFSKHMVEWLDDHPAQADSIRQLQQHITAWRKSGSDFRMEDQIDFQPGKNRQPSAVTPFEFLLERVHGGAKKFYRMFVDKNDIGKDYDNDMLAVSGKDPGEGRRVYDMMMALQHAGPANARAAMNNQVFSPRGNKRIGSTAEELVARWHQDRELSEAQANAMLQEIHMSNLEALERQFGYVEGVEGREDRANELFARIQDMQQRGPQTVDQVEISSVNLRPLMKLVQSKDYKQFVTYIAAQQGLEMWDRNINPGFARSDAEAYIEKHGNDEWDEAAESLRQFHRSIVFMLVHTGRSSSITEAMRIVGSHSNYVPFFRSGVKHNQRSFGGATLFDAPSLFKRRHGAGDRIIDPLVSTLKMATQFYSAANRHMVADTVISNALESQTQADGFDPTTPHGFKRSSVIDEVPISKMQHHINASEVWSDPKLREDLIAAGLTEDEIKKMDQATLGTVISVWRPDYYNRGGGKYVLHSNADAETSLLELRLKRAKSLLGMLETTDEDYAEATKAVDNLARQLSRKSTPRLYQFRDENLYNSLMSPSVSPLWNNAMGKAILASSELFRSGATAMNSAFALTNAPRDYMAYYLQRPGTIPENIRDIIATAKDDRTHEQNEALFNFLDGNKTTEEFLSTKRGRAIFRTKAGARDIAAPIRSVAEFIASQSREFLGMSPDSAADTTSASRVYGAVSGALTGAAAGAFAGPGAIPGAVVGAIAGATGGAAAINSEWARKAQGKVAMWRQMGGEMNMFQGLDKGPGFLGYTISAFTGEDPQAKHLQGVIKRDMDAEQANPWEAFKHNAKNFAKPSNWMGNLRAVIGISEIGPRLALFEQTMTNMGWNKERIAEEGMPPEDVMIASIDAAADVTLNFGRMGEYMRGINRAVPFLNSQVQGLDKFIRTWRSGKQIKIGNFELISQQLAFRLMTTLVPATIAYWFAVKDEDWYKQAPQWLKDGYFIFADRDGKMIARVPAPYEWVYFKMGIEGTLNWYEDEQPEALSELEAEFRKKGPADDLAGGMYRLGVPSVHRVSILWPGIEVMSNWDYFREKPIESEKMQKMNVEDRMNFRTSWVAKQFRDFLPPTISPVKFDHLMNGHTGGMYGRLDRLLTGTDHPSKMITSGVTLRKNYTKAEKEFYSRDSRMEQEANSAANDIEVAKRGKLPQSEIDQLTERHAKILQRSRELQRYKSLISDMRKTIRGESNREKRFQVERFMAGVAMEALGHQPLDLYPVPWTRDDLDPKVQAAVDGFLGRLLAAATAPPVRPNAGESRAKYDRRDAARQQRARWAEVILRRTGMTPEQLVEAYKRYNASLTSPKPLFTRRGVSGFGRRIRRILQRTE